MILNLILILLWPSTESKKEEILKSRGLTGGQKMAFVFKSTWSFRLTTQLFKFHTPGVRGIEGINMYSKVMASTSSSAGQL